MYTLKSLFNIENKLVFFINFLLVFLMIITFLFEFEVSFFFYFTIFLTLILGYLFFRKSKKLSKTIILTNLFIFFYFLYPSVATFLTKLLGSQSYLFILFYTIFLSYIFLFLSGNHRTFLGNLKKWNYKIAGISLMLGLSFGLLFYLIQEPVPRLFLDFIEDGSIFEFIKFILISSLIIAIAEQMIFSGFLFNSYKELTTKWDSFFQVAIVFVCFHLLRFDILVKHYFVNFPQGYLFFITSYYILLFIFMVIALYLYSFRYKKYEGNFTYPVLLHFGADLGLLFFYILPFVL